MIKIDVQVVARDGGAIIRTVTVDYPGESTQGVYEAAERKQDELNASIDATRFYTQLGEPRRVERTR